MPMTYIDSTACLPDCYYRQEWQVLSQLNFFNGVNDEVKMLASKLYQFLVLVRLAYEAVPSRSNVIARGDNSCILRQDKGRPN